MKIILALAAALVAWYFVSFFMQMIGLGLFGFPAGLVVAIVVFIMAKGKSASGPPASSMPAGFNPDFRHGNIAIDSKSNMIWLRDRKSGKTAFLNKGDLLRWSHRYTTGNNGVWVKNYIDVEVRDLQHPKYEVAFNQHGEGLIWGARKNQAECEEWQSRLTTWVNNT